MGICVDFDSIKELETALKAMVLFKFSEDGEADVFTDSPIMSQSVVTLLGAVERYWCSVGNSKNAKGWRDLYSASSLALRKDRVGFVARRARQHGKWDSLTHAGRVDWIKVAASPYRLSDEEVVLIFHPLLALE